MHGKVNRGGERGLEEASVACEKASMFEEASVAWGGERGLVVGTLHL